MTNNGLTFTSDTAGNIELYDAGTMTLIACYTDVTAGQFLLVTPGNEYCFAIETLGSIGSLASCVVLGLFNHISTVICSELGYYPEGESQKSLVKLFHQIRPHGKLS